MLRRGSICIITSCYLKKIKTKVKKQEKRMLIDDANKMNISRVYDITFTTSKQFLPIQRIITMS